MSGSAHYQQMPEADVATALALLNQKLDFFIDELKKTNEKIGNHDERIDDLESDRDKARGRMVLLAPVAGIISGTVVLVIGSLLNGGAL